MPKIVSRQSPEQAQILYLQEVLKECSSGALGLVSEGALVDLEPDMMGLIEQTHGILQAMNSALEAMHVRSQILAIDLAAISVTLDAAQDTIANLVGNIDYDEAMDHATADLMDCLASSGSANVTADGKITFDERASLSREDLKPMLREAIVRWVELKMSQ